jgi:hypothetical protein
MANLRIDSPKEQVKRKAMVCGKLHELKMKGA